MVSRTATSLALATRTVFALVLHLGMGERGPQASLALLLSGVSLCQSRLGTGGLKWNCWKLFAHFRWFRCYVEVVTAHLQRRGDNPLGEWAGLPRCTVSVWLLRAAKIQGLRQFLGRICSCSSLHFQQEGKRTLALYL